MKHHNHSHAHVWSNGAFIIAAIVLAVKGHFLPATGLFVLGVSSWIGHLKGGKWWLLDWAGMYVSFLSIIAYHLDIPYTWVIWPFVIWATIRFRFESIPMIGILLSVSLLLAYHAETYYLLSIVYFFLALMFRKMTNDYDEEYNIFHSAWHVLAAIAYVALVL